ncbi:MAG: hypothetical protein IKP96_05080 [Elusimicrobiaceae bacterium]|nr:hypothetical protein [Elusimicrobiaceae bacterium]
MKKIFILVGISILLCACQTVGRKEPLRANAFPKAADFSFFCKKRFPQGQPAKIIFPQELDVRSCDISSWDLTEYTAVELANVISFDSKTKFPPRAKLPKDFSPKRILQNGQKPGLGVRALHAQGVTGKDVTIAIIDQNLLLNHKEYENGVMFYEEDKDFWGKVEDSSMHAPAVVSIAVGKNTGVAPEARVVALAPASGENSKNQYDARPNAAALRRVIQLNAQLPPKEKIKVVSISRGFDASDLGASEFEAAKNTLEKDGVAVFTTNDVFTLSRNHSLDNPEDIANYCRPAYWLGKQNIKFLSTNMQNSVVAPMDFRTTASPTGNNDYVHYANGGLSWVVPYVAGLYALGVQVYPQLTKDIFVRAAHETATVRRCEYEGESFSMSLVNPARLINYLKSLNKSTQN